VYVAIGRADGVVYEVVLDDDVGDEDVIVEAEDVAFLTAVHGVVGVAI
jgi:hypothetical protein